MKFGLKFRERYQKAEDGSIAEEFDNLVAFLQTLWDKIVDSEGNLKVSLTDNSHGGAGTSPVYVNLGDQVITFDNDIADLQSQISGLSSELNVVGYSTTNLRALNTAPPTLLPAQGAGSIVIPVAWTSKTITTTASGGPAPTLRCRFSGVTLDLLTTLLTGANSIQTRSESGVLNPWGATESANPVINKDILLSASADVGATWVGSVQVKMWYVKVTNFS